VEAVPSSPTTSEIASVHFVLSYSSQTLIADKTLVVAEAKSSPADSISAEQDEALISVSVALQSLIELVIATPVRPSSCPAAMMSEEQSELALEAQSSTALATSSVAAARSIAALLMS